MENLKKSIELALDEINQFQPPDNQIKLNPNEIIIGPNGILDSLSTATFLLELENAYAKITGINIDFAELVISEDGLAKDFKLKDIENLLVNEK